MTVFFSRLDSECLARMIRVGATRVALRTQKDYGGYGVYSILGPPTLRLISATLPSHTHLLNCLCFFHYFYCLFSALCAPWPCGKVTMAAAVCSHCWALMSRKWLWGWSSGNDNPCPDHNEYENSFFIIYF